MDWIAIKMDCNKNGLVVTLPPTIGLDQPLVPIAPNQQKDKPMTSMMVCNCSPKMVLIFFYIFIKMVSFKF
jgi:hypothetical protein